jgi:hypothetical protein
MATEYFIILQAEHNGIGVKSSRSTDVSNLFWQQTAKRKFRS